MAQKKVYDNEFKIQAVKLGREIGFSKAAKELGIHADTLRAEPQTEPQTKQNYESGQECLEIGQSFET